MAKSSDWSREQLLVAFKLYCQLPFGQFHYRNTEIIRWAELINRTPSALAMKLSNIASLDPEITRTGRRGLSGASTADRKMWQEMHQDWGSFALRSSKAMKTFAGTEMPEHPFLAPDSEMPDLPESFLGQSTSTRELSSSKYRIIASASKVLPKPTLSAMM